MTDKPTIYLGCGKHGRPVLPDHFGPEKCDYVPLPYAKMLFKRLNTVSPSTKIGAVGATNLTSCMRKRFLRDFMIQHMQETGEHQVVDARRYWAMEMGTYGHMAFAAKDYEQVVDEEDRLVLNIGDVSILCVPDVYQGGKVVEYKWTKSLYYLKKQGKPKDDHIIQCSIYGQAIKQNGLGTPTSGRIYYMSHDDCHAFDFPLLGMADILKYRVAPGWKIEDNLALLSKVGEMRRAGADWEKVCESLPLTGDKIFFGKNKMCTHYCNMANLCEQVRSPEVSDRDVEEPIEETFDI